MDMTTFTETPRLEPVDPAEAEARLNVAACYRLISLYGLDDLTDGFASSRIGSSGDFIVGGYGLLPELACASGLHRRSLSDKAKLEKSAGVDIDAFNFSKTAMTARPEFNACIHAHSPWAVIFSTLNCELLPMSQYSMMFQGKIGYVEYADTNVTSEQACEQMGEHLARGAEAVILGNHGLLVPGRSMAQAFFHLYRLEQACRYQIQAMATGAPIITAPAGRLDEIRLQFWTMTHIDNDGSREWPGLLTKLDCLDPSYRN
jgi:ribulose-5-phosphate 4-epimerase/fuculose-1-phosphate aldolase